ncbi:MAG: ATP-dependent Clp protease proteolytic subunit [Bacteroidales bacterium]|nr:ATP-dependent Clp protease proteolytic subunit [Bacteroidales bacterium]
MKERSSIIFKNSAGEPDDIYIYGEIGYEIDGNFLGSILAQEYQNVDSLNVHINSFGGDVLHGYSIFSALYDIKGKINVIIDGVAGSMAGVISQVGDHVSIKDYGRYQMHDPSIGKKHLSDKEKEQLQHIKDSLATILSRRGLSKNDISKLMTEDTWFTPKEAKDAGLIDEIISTKRKAEDLITEAIYDSVKETTPANSNSNKNYNQNTQNTDTMTYLFKMLNVSSEKQVENAVKKLIDDNTSLETKVNNQKKKIEELENTISETKEKTAKKTVENLIERGLLDSERKDKLVDLAKRDKEAFNLFVDNISASEKNTDVNNHVGDNAATEKRKKEEKSQPLEDAKEFQRLREEDPAALAKLEETDNKKFERLYNAWANSDL